MKIRPIPFHPFLVAAFQILSIYAVNVNMANVKIVTFWVLLIVFFAAIIFLLLFAITRDAERSAIIVTFYCFLFFVYGRFYNLYSEVPLTEQLIGKNRYLLSLYGVIVITGTLWIFRSGWCEKYIRRITSFLNVFSLALILIVAVLIMVNFDWISSLIRGNREFASISISNEKIPVSQNKKRIVSSLPNVYFIILDSYGSQNSLAKYFDWNDVDTVNAFRARGFYVNQNAHSNYPFTILSLASTLDMGYIHETPGFINAKHKELYLTKLIQQNKVSQRFRRAGYDVVSNMGNAKNIGGGASLFSDPFSALVIEISILRIIEFKLTADQMRRKDLSTLEWLMLLDIPERPTFYISYIRCPHPPYIFHRDGTKPKFSDANLGIRNIKGYINQVRFIGPKIIEIVHIIRDRDPDAVIIVQADHGAGWVIYGHILDSKRPTPEFIRVQYGILHAIYSPPGIMVSDNVTPVNLFRYLFNSLFDDKFEILPDRAFFTRTTEPYMFYDVTNDLNDPK